MDRLGPLVQLRNRAAHGERTSRDAATDARDQMLGIGGEGLIARLARIKQRLA